MTTLELKYTTLTKVFEGYYRDDDGNEIYRDDFGDYTVWVSGTWEEVGSLEKAIEIMNNDRYWR